MRLDSFRTWLEKNKVFFEVFSVVVLGVMGVLVSYSAHQVAKYQAVIAGVEVAAQLRADVDLELNKETGVYTEDVLRVYNDGYRIREVDLSAVTFLEVQSAGAVPQPPRYLWMTYYGASFPTGASTGLLDTFRGYRNNLEAARIEKEAREHDPSAPSVRVQVTRVLFASYTDALGNRHEDAIWVPSVGGSRLLSESEEQSWRRLYTITRDSSTPRELGTIKGSELGKLFASLPTKPTA